MLDSFNLINSRKRIIFSILLDILLICLIFNFIPKEFINKDNLFSTKLIDIFTAWILSSYISGRYHETSHKKRFSLKKNINSTLSVITTFSFLIYIYKAISYLIFQNKIIAIDYIFITMMTSIIAIFGNILTSFLRNCSKSKIKEWLLISSKETYDLILKEANKSSQAYNLTWIDQTSKQPSKIPNDLEGVIVEDLNMIEVWGITKLTDLNKNDIKIINISNWFSLNFENMPSNLLTNRDLIELSTKISEESFQLEIKKIADIILSSFLLLITLPITILIALLIKLQDGGPIFYSQIRNGISENKFRIFKFRSMILNAERDGAQWSSNNDKRITKLGSLLRSTRIDELPQLIAVIQGKMSLIGPRPERPEFDDELKVKVPNYKLRYKLKPGLSGWAQVNYPYGASISDSKNKLSYDIYYLKHFSIFLDFLILFKTIRLVFNPKGAMKSRKY